MEYIFCFGMGMLLMGLLEILDILTACLLISWYRSRSIFS